MELPCQIGPVFLADLNLDGSDDLVLAVAATDGFGNPFTAGVRWVQSRGGENPFPSEAFDEVALFPSFSGPLRDFDGDGTLEYVQANGFVAPSTFGPVFSAGFDFVGRNTNFLPSNLIEDFDGDGDVDFVYQYGNEFQTYFLVRNQIVDERSGVTFAMRDLGVLGADANPNSDADGDGETNFEEFIFGGNPIEPSIVGDRSRLNVGVSSERAATFSVNKAALAAGVNYRMKVSSDLEEWQSVPIDFVQDEDAFWEDWQALPLNSPNCFYRLVVEP